MTYATDQTVYLPDGREAIYVTHHNGTHLVRVMYDGQSSYDEPPYSYPSETVTAVTEVFPVPPVARYDAVIIERQKIVEALRQQAAELQADMRKIERNKTEMEKAAAKYPDISDALDFIEGRITHVVKWRGYGAATIHTLPEAFEDVETWSGRRQIDGMKLLCLFGTDKSGKRTWCLNQYRDGSGSSWETIWPARGEAEARSKVAELLDAAVSAWRAGNDRWHVGQVGISETLKANPWLQEPEDWTAHREAVNEKERQQKIEKLRAELAELESPK